MKHSQRVKLMRRYPSIVDLRDRARKRLPHIAWEYLECGTGDEQAVTRNLESMSAITLVPRFMKGELNLDVATTLFGRSYNAPIRHRTDRRLWIDVAAGGAIPRQRRSRVFNPILSEHSGGRNP